jgi:hypothetical protein
MKLHLPQVLRCLVPASSVVSLPVGAETIDNGSAPTEPVNHIAGQLAGFDSLTSEALLLVVFILLVLLVIAHKPKVP